MTGKAEQVKWAGHQQPSREISKISQDDCGTWQKGRRPVFKRSMNNNTAFSLNNLGKALGVVVLCSVFALILVINILPFLDDDHSLMDFGSFYASGLKAGQGENPYDPNSQYIFEIQFPRIGAGGRMANLNPPVSVVLFQFLSRFDPQPVLLIWRILSAILYGGVVMALTRIYRENITFPKFVWAFALAGFWHTLVLGQVYIFLLAFEVLGWFFLQEKKYIPAGIAIGLLIAIKPNFMIWSLCLLVTGYYAAFVASFLTSLALSLIPLFLYGTNIYAQWIEASAIGRATLIMPGNNSVLGLTARFQAVELGIVVSLLLVLVVLILLKRKLRDGMQPPETVSAFGVLVSILAAPISWTGYTILLLPIFFSWKKWSWPVTISALILSVPFAIVLQLHQTSPANFVIFGWLYGWAILLLLGAVVRKTIMTNNIQTSWSTSSRKL